MSPKKRNIVEQLRQAIADSNQTEYAIAKGSGVSQSVVNRLVHGEPLFTGENPTLFHD